MSFSLPYNRQRRYLTGIDWLIGTMAHATKSNYGIGGFSQAVLEIDGHLPEQALRPILEQISNRFPLLHARQARDWLNLAPYWKISQKNPLLLLRVVALADHETARATHLFDQHVNLPFESENQHIRFLLIHLGGKKSRLGMVFDHRLFDAFAAETCFRLIDQTWQGNLDEIAARVKQTEPAHLDHWSRRFQSGKKLNRLLISQNEEDVCALGMPAPGPHAIHFLHEKLSREESAAFNRRAGEEISVPIVLPSATARAVVALQSALRQMPLPGGQFMVFTSSNMRSAGQEWETFLSNQFSLMPLSVPIESGTDVKTIAIGLRDQLFERMKSNIPFVMQDAAMLGRICPHAIGKEFLRFIARGRMCSFYFACLRESGFTGDKFMGMPTVNLIHTPLVFSPPGLNICMTSFRGCFNLVISYLDGAITDDAAKRMMEAFKASLLI